MSTFSYTFNSVTYTASELLDGAGASDGSSGIAYSRVFQVSTSAQNIHPVTVIASAYAQRVSGTVTYTGRLPIRRDTDGTYYCQNVRCDPEAGDNQTYKYVADFSRVELSELPWNDPPEVEWGGISRQEQYAKDVNDKPCANTAGVMFDPLPSREAGDDAVTITVKRQTWSPGIGSQFSNTVNSNAMWGSAIPAGSAFLGRITARKEKEDSYTYWRVSFPITFKENGWDFEALNTGFETKSATKTNTATGGPLLEKITARDPVTTTYAPISGPVILDAAGTAVYTGTNAPTVTLVPYVHKDWSSLDIPSPF